MKRLLYCLIIVLLLPAVAVADKNSVAMAKKLAKKGETYIWLRPAPPLIDEARFEFVRNNLISTFYHEFAHALIDILDLPVLGLEESAADNFSVVMVNRMFNATDALAINSDAARAYKIDAHNRIKNGRDWDWADEHGTEMQRFYNIVCLAYGADTEAHEGFSKQMGLPKERAETCQDEFEMANKSWHRVIKQVEMQQPENTVKYRQTTRTQLQIRAARVIEAEVNKLNQTFNLPESLRVRIKPCRNRGRFLASYSNQRNKITICTNYIDDLYRDALNKCDHRLQTCDHRLQNRDHNPLKLGENLNYLR